MSDYNKVLAGLWLQAEEATHDVARNHAELVLRLRQILDLHEEEDGGPPPVVPEAILALAEEYHKARREGYWPANGHFQCILSAIVRHSLIVADETEYLWRLLSEFYPDWVEGQCLPLACS